MQKWVINNADMQSTEQVDIMTACFAPLFGGCDTANTTGSTKLTLKRNVAMQVQSKGLQIAAFSFS